MYARKKNDNEVGNNFGRSEFMDNFVNFDILEFYGVNGTLRATRPISGKPRRPIIVIFCVVGQSLVFVLAIA